MKILIIDDSKPIRMFLSGLARELGFSIIEAADGLDGLKTLLHNDPAQPFDVVLVDWDMPRMTGIEFVRYVRRNKEHENLKLMMVTTNNTVAKVTEAIQSGANEYLMKPVTKESLAGKLLLLGVLPEIPASSDDLAIPGEPAETAIRDAVNQ